MTTTPEYRVHPRTVHDLDVDESRMSLLPDWTGQAIGATLGLGILAVAVALEWINDGSTFLMFLILAGAAAVPIGVIQTNSRRRMAKLRWHEEELDRLRQVAAEEAANVELEAGRLREEAMSRTRRCATLSTSLDGELGGASDDFGRRAFGPFWARLETASRVLCELQETAEEMASLEAAYAALLEPFQHDFPSNVCFQVLHPTQDHQRRLAELVLRAQVDFEFTVVGQQVEARRTLLDGLGILGGLVQSEAQSHREALGACTMALVNSNMAAAEAVQQSIRSSSQDLVQAIEKQGGESRSFLERQTDRLVGQATRTRRVLRRS